MPLLKKIFLFSVLLLLNNTAQNMLASQQPNQQMLTCPAAAATVNSNKSIYIPPHNRPKTLLFVKAGHEKELAELKIKEQELLSRVDILKSQTGEHVAGTPWTPANCKLAIVQAELNSNQQGQSKHQEKLADTIALLTKQTQEKK